MRLVNFLTLRMSIGNLFKQLMRNEVRDKFRRSRSIDKHSDPALIKCGGFLKFVPDDGTFPPIMITFLNRQILNNKSLAIIERFQIPSFSSIKPSRPNFISGALPPNPKALQHRG